MNIQYSVTWSTHDLNQMRPVMGLPPAPQAAIGVWWEGMCCEASNNLGESGVAS